MSLSGVFPIESSSLYQFYKEELREIEKLKFHLSMEAGYDVGLSRANWVWLTGGRERWLQSRKSGDALAALF